jgi:nitronate monooxygenase
MAQIHVRGVRLGCAIQTVAQCSPDRHHQIRPRLLAPYRPDLNDPRFDFENVIPQSLPFLRCAGIEREITLIAAGGVRTHADIVRLQGLGAAAVQPGTPFAVTEKGDAHAGFKRVLAEADDAEMVEFTSVAGLPVRAVGTPWLRAYLKIEDMLEAVSQAKSRCTKNFDCLAQ